MADESSTAQADWISGAVDAIVDNVDKARGVGTDNIIRAVRALVYGLVIAVFGIAALILTVVIVVRMADAYLPIGNGVGDATWAAHLFIGSLLSILGLGCWLNRKTEGLRWVVLALIVDVAIIVTITCYAIIDAFV